MTRTELFPALPAFPFSAKSYRTGLSLAAGHTLAAAVTRSHRLCEDRGLHTAGAGSPWLEVRRPAAA